MFSWGTLNEMRTLCEMCPNTAFFLVRIQSECRKIRTEKTPYLDTFHAVGIKWVKIKTCPN